MVAFLFGPASALEPIKLPLIEQPRTWRSADGKAFTGRLLWADDTHAFFKSRGKREFSVVRERFADADRSYLDQFREDRAKRNVGWEFGLIEERFTNKRSGTTTMGGDRNYHVDGDQDEGRLQLNFALRGSFPDHLRKHHLELFLGTQSYKHAASSGAFRITYQGRKVSERRGMARGRYNVIHLQANLFQNRKGTDDPVIELEIETSSTNGAAFLGGDSIRPPRLFVPLRL